MSSTDSILKLVFQFRRKNSSIFYNHSSNLKKKLKRACFCTNWRESGLKVMQCFNWTELENSHCLAPYTYFFFFTSSVSERSKGHTFYVYLFTFSNSQTPGEYLKRETLTPRPLGFVCKLVRFCTRPKRMFEKHGCFACLYLRLCLRV